MISAKLKRRPSVDSLTPLPSETSVSFNESSMTSLAAAATTRSYDVNRRPSGVAQVMTYVGRMRLPALTENRHQSVTSLPSGTGRYHERRRQHADSIVISRPVNYQARERFQYAAKRLIILLRVTEMTRQKAKRVDQMSFYLYKDELLRQKISTYGGGFAFDLSYYHKPEEHQLTPETKMILSMEPGERTEEQIRTALVALSQAVETFGEFPLKMQRSLVRVGWYEHFEAKRIIIRQDHLAENFYLILFGTAVVTVLETDPRTGESRLRTVACLGRGNTFGEVALMQGTKRGATVTCKDDVELLAVGRSDYVAIFMQQQQQGRAGCNDQQPEVPTSGNSDPEHIAFLHSIDLLRGVFPIHLLPRNNPKICMLTYFRRGNVICRDSNDSDWIYVIKTGSCRVLKKLDRVTPSVPGLEIRTYSRDVTRTWSAHRLGTAQGSHALILSPNPHLKHILFRERLLPKRPTTIRLREPDVNRKNDHERKIDKILQRKEELLQQQQMASSVNQYTEDAAAAFVELQKLGPRDTFGVEQVAFSAIERCASVSLVSDGAEAVLINKRFFLQHLNDEKKKKLRSIMRPYPSDDDLQRKLQQETDWEAFKKTIIHDLVEHNAAVRRLTA